MRLCWVKDRVTTKELYIYWKAGDDNFADYFTKHFSPSHYQQICPKYILINHHINSELQREGVLIYHDKLIYPDINPWGGQYSKH